MMATMRRWVVLLVGLIAVWPSMAQESVNQLVDAVAAGRPDEVRALLVQGVDVNATNAAGRPLLVVAGFNGNRRTALVLLAAGADVDAVDSAGTSALMAASAFGHKDLVDILVVAGADVNLKDADGRSALARATLGRHAAVIETLKTAGAVEDSGGTP